MLLMGKSKKMVKQWLFIVLYHLNPL